MDKSEVKRLFFKLVEDNPKTIRIMRSESDVDSINFDKVISEVQMEYFNNGEEYILTFISQCLSDGRQVSVLAAGPNKILVWAAKDLFKKSIY